MDLPFLLERSNSSELEQINVSILILMDLPFLSEDFEVLIFAYSRFNPYSNGSSFFIHLNFVASLESFCFNPYSNGSSFFIRDMGIWLLGNIT